MEKEIQIYREFLKSKNLKLTKPRLTILKAIFRNHEHFNVDNLYEQIRKKQSNVSRATIYRTIPLLLESGLIKLSLRCDSKDIYEHSYGHENHLHFICTNCGSIKEASFIKVEKLINQLAVDANFKITEYHLSARGLCENCRKSTDQ
ncbi:MAG: transcriptional repressor [Candidatus Cloacimonetes bacterium]|nr:transcriptional repressor [Candidatus Cloacimonadota bacterium]